jgi:hypothetical protein
MTQSTDEMHSPALFTHAKRKDWGLGVLAWDDGGKRGYLFEDGEERTMADGFHELMRKVEHLNPEQREAFLRLRRVLATRASARAGADTGPSFSKQLASFRESYPAGFFDPKWILETRGEGVERRTPHHRAPLIREAHERLAAEALDPLLSRQHFKQAWDLVLEVLGHTDLVPAVQLRKLKSTESEQQRELSLATRDLLYAKLPFDRRFDRFAAAAVAHSGEELRWEMATGVSAVVHPEDHVCISATVLRLQLKSIGSGATVATRPTSAAYAHLLAVARSAAKKLTEQGERPRDLMDVYDFMLVTLKAPPRSTKAKPKAKVQKVVSEEEAEADE